MLESVAARGHGRDARQQDELGVFDERRIRQNIASVLADQELWLAPAYTLAIQAEYLLEVLDGKRQQASPSTARVSWTDEKRLALLADTRPAEEIAAELGTTRSNVHYQRCKARKLLAAA